MNATESAKLAERMSLAAQHFARDLGLKKYSTEAHANAAGYAISKAIEDGLAPTPENLRDAFYQLYNQSAWRQKFEKAGIFPKATEASLTDLMGSLKAEGA